MDPALPATANRQNLLICLTVVLISLAIYARTAGFEFVQYDDPEFALNPHATQGVTPEALVWALSSVDDSNWMPVTRFSYIFGHAIFGPRSGPDHVVNVLLHILASLMVFWFLLRATGDPWPSAFTCLLFAVHPLHVESVAWVAERKDVLCALFWFLTLWAWVGYVTRPSRAGYFRALLFFCLGLLSKPMIVTLPVVMLLLDRWPLRRQISARTVAEKIPFAVLAVSVSIVTFFVQRAEGTLQSFEKFSATIRLENALLTWIIYPAKMIWPAKLAAMYPYPEAIPVWMATVCGVAIVGVSLLVIVQRKRFPCLLTGWFWYLVATLPVIGLVQVGIQARADRYMYIPMVGLAIPLAWGVQELVYNRPAIRPWALGTASAGLAILSICAWNQAGYWRNSEALFDRAVQTTDGNYLAWENLGGALARQPGRLGDAITSFEAEIRIRPERSEAHDNLAQAFRMAGRSTEAEGELETALELDRTNWRAHDHRGALLASLGRTDEAFAEYRAAIQVRPSEPVAHTDFGSALVSAGRSQEGLREYDEALRIDPYMTTAHNNKGWVLLTMGDLESAKREFEAALKIDPDMPDAHVNLARALSESGRIDDALAHIRAAVRIRPDAKSVALLDELEKRAYRPN